MQHKDKFSELREKFNIHPLIFHRSKEHSKNLGELYDILVMIPSLPIVWDDKERKWIQPDLIFINKLDIMLEKI
jgi:hypothetical protein